jgi:flagellin
MAMTINTNIAALNAQRNLGRTQGALNKSLQRLSSGLRINSAKDDAAGLAISNRMGAQIRGLDQAARNANDGISVAQLAEGAMQESTNLLQRIRELSIQSANASNSGTDRSSLQAEVNQLQQELDRIASTTTFNGLAILDGSFQNQSFHVGSEANQTISVSITSVAASDLAMYSYVGANDDADQGTGSTTTMNAALQDNTIAAQTLTINGTNSETVSVTANWSASQVAGAINEQTASTGVTASATTTATIQTLGSNGDITFNLGSAKTDLTAISVTGATAADLTAVVSAINAKSGQTGVSAAIDATDTTKLTLTQNDGKDIFIDTFTHSGVTKTVEVVGSSDATAEVLTSAVGDCVTVSGEVTLTATDSFSATSSIADSAGSVFNAAAGVMGTVTTSAVSSIDISSVSGANTAINIIDAALTKIDTTRGNLGSVQNRLESTISNLQSVAENVAAARARIMDADFAAETAELTKAQVMQQAGVAMLAQANMLPQAVLSLLQ